MQALEATVDGKTEHSKTYCVVLKTNLKRTTQKQIMGLLLESCLYVRTSNYIKYTTHVLFFPERITLTAQFAWIQKQ